MNMQLRRPGTSTLARHLEITTAPMRGEAGGAEFEVSWMPNGEDAVIGDPATLVVEVGGRSAQLVLGRELLQMLTMDVPGAGEEFGSSPAAGALIVEYAASALLQRLEAVLGETIVPTALLDGNRIGAEPSLAARLRFADAQEFPVVLACEAVAGRLLQVLERCDPDLADWVECFGDRSEFTGSVVAGMFEAAERQMISLAAGDVLGIDGAQEGLQGALILDEGSYWPVRLNGDHVVIEAQGGGPLIQDSSGIPDLGMLAPPVAAGLQRYGFLMAKCTISPRQLRGIAPGQSFAFAPLQGVQLIGQGRSLARGTVVFENGEMLFRVAQVTSRSPEAVSGVAGQVLTPAVNIGFRF